MVAEFVVDGHLKKRYCSILVIFISNCIILCEYENCTNKMLMQFELARVVNKQQLKIQAGILDLKQE